MHAKSPQIPLMLKISFTFIFRPLSAMKCKKEICLGMLCVIIAMCGFRRQGHSKLAEEGVGTHCVEPIADVGCG